MDTLYGYFIEVFDDENLDKTLSDIRKITHFEAWWFEIPFFGRKYVSIPGISRENLDKEKIKQLENIGNRTRDVFYNEYLYYAEGRSWVVYQYMPLQEPIEP